MAIWLAIFLFGMILDASMLCVVLINTPLCCEGLHVYVNIAA
jgi:hypothetical protein